MTEHIKAEKYRTAYTPFDFHIPAVDLVFDIAEHEVWVTARLSVERVPNDPDDQGPMAASKPEFELFLGEPGSLTSVLVDGSRLPRDAYEVLGDRIRVPDVPDQFVLESHTRLHPHENTSFEGLYESGGNLYTQCEAEGFRRITPFADRPDVLSVYTVTIKADQKRYPVLLSNGNRLSQSTDTDGVQTVVWYDPYPKPGYLFALVAGRFDHCTDRFVTCSGRHVDLHFWTDVGEGDKVAHAMQALKESMLWDERVYNLEYDLDVYNVVAVSDFNMGAMENKSLNIFNTSCVLARPDTATDQDYAAVQAVIAHEYFHNWTGNRITCRDWFQLSLKEGLTVFRDQEFSADMGSRAVKRIEDVRTLRAIQFPEDAGPMAHPIRPESYQEINNFYTATVYEKGAEVIRMIHTLLGSEGFQKGMACYVARHDGQAVTCEDFLCAMEAGSGVDLTQFRLWYSQAGTPIVTIKTVYDPDAEALSVTVSQMTPATPGQSDKAPLHIPLSLGFVAADGSDLSTLAQLVHVTAAEQTFVIEAVPPGAVLSPLRGFSAPVKLKHDLSPVQQLHLMAHDTDGFVRWDMTQTMVREQIMSSLNGLEQDASAAVLSDALIAAFQKTIRSDQLDLALKALLLTLPSESLLGESMTIIDTDGVHILRDAARQQVATELASDWQAVYEQTCAQEPYVFTPEAVGRRALNAVALSYLMRSRSAVDAEAAAEMALAQFQAADNMTDQFAALMALTHSEAPQKVTALTAFYDQWQDTPLVLNKWFSVQASYAAVQTLDVVQQLMQHDAFTLKNPNRVRSLVGVFSRGNPFVFHQADGTGYRLLADVVMQLDGLNPQIAASAVIPLTTWRRFDPERQARMMSELKRVLEMPGLSVNTYEHVSKSLA